MKTVTLKRIIFTLLLSSLTQIACADWILNNSESSLNFISIKKSKVGEVNRFKELEGSINNSGKVVVSVKLNSVETNIPLRNERMEKFLFETTKFASASVASQINPVEISKLNTGDSFSKKINLDLDIHGKQQTLKAVMRITLLSGNKLLVSTVHPIILNMSQFALIKGIEKLKALAKLPSISSAVPVTASFIFENK